MKYPKRSEIYPLIMTGGYAPTARRYGITLAEIFEIDRHDAVSAETQAWADDLRARCPKAFEVHHV